MNKFWEIYTLVAQVSFGVFLVPVVMLVMYNLVRVPIVFVSSFAKNIKEWRDFDKRFKSWTFSERKEYVNRCKSIHRHFGKGKFEWPSWSLLGSFQHACGKALNSLKG